MLRSSTEFPPVLPFSSLIVVPSYFGVDIMSFRRSFVVLLSYRRRNGVEFQHLKMAVRRLVWVCGCEDKVFIIWSYFRYYCQTTLVSLSSIAHQALSTRNSTCRTSVPTRLREQTNFSLSTCSHNITYASACDAINATTSNPRHLVALQCNSNTQQTDELLGHTTKRNNSTRWGCPQRRRQCV